jgi:hypothetical protein
MASKYNPINDIYICECGSSEHQFIFRIYDFADEMWVEDDPCCSLDVFLSEQPFWTRLKRGLTYIFGYKCRYGHFDTADISYKDAHRLILGMLKFRRKVREYRQYLLESKTIENNLVINVPHDPPLPTWLMEPRR